MPAGAGLQRPPPASVGALSTASCRAIHPIVHRVGRVPLHSAQQRWGDAADLAGAYQFLASDASAFVTGVVLNVDGGYLLV